MRVIVIEGPTAVGKSELALQLAERLETEIISADSRQIYRGMDIGTAKPTPEEQRRVRHHLIDIIDPDQVYSAGQFAHETRACAERMIKAGMIPLLVGGTGFYVRAFLNGLFESPMIPPDVRERWRVWAEQHPGEAHRKLETIDPESAGRLHPNDIHRILRALEVAEATGITLGEHWRRQSAEHPISALRIGLQQEREILYQRIDARCETMLHKGLLDEIETLRKNGYALQSPGLKTVGYCEYWPYFEGGAALETCLAQAQQHTRNYAKRQLTWYRGCDFDLTFDLGKTTISQVLEQISRVE